MKEQGDEKSEPVLDTVRSSNGRHGGFKKKNGKSDVPNNNNEYFRHLVSSW